MDKIMTLLIWFPSFLILVSMTLFLADQPGLALKTLILALWTASIILCVMFYLTIRDIFKEL